MYWKTELYCEIIRKPAGDGTFYAAAVKVIKTGAEQTQEYKKKLF